MDLEVDTYANHHKTTYLAQKALLPVFVDATERSPTFRIQPLDTADVKEKQAWFQVWSTADNPQQAWDMLLGRPFHGLTPELYERPFQEKIDDPYLRKTALTSLTHAGKEQQNLYDLSFSPKNIKEKAPVAGDLGVAFLLSENLNARFMDFFKLVLDAKANLVLVSVFE